ncbi:MAG: hypothetical protein Q4B57_09200, partial [Eubacteriales bacterium]|nr:hypothetical protein [Eubacteriales bacterium]
MKNMRRGTKWMAVLLSCAMTMSSVTAPAVYAEEVQLQETVDAETTEASEAEREEVVQESAEAQEAAPAQESAESQEEAAPAPAEQTETAEQQTEPASETESESQEQSETAETEIAEEIESENIQKIITGIISPEESILHQEVKQGAEESEICFPETLQTMVTDTEGEKEESLAVEWELSNAEVFASEEADAVFTYTAKFAEEYEISENIKLPEITVTIKEATEAFDQSTIIDNIKITVKADEGV